MKTLFEHLTTERYIKNRQLLSFPSRDFLSSVFDDGDNQVLDLAAQAPDVKEIFEGVREVFGYENYQVNNPYKFHKNKPSARNIHPEIPFVLILGKVFRYDVATDRFILIGDTPYSKKCIIHVGLDIGRLSAIYGTFGMALALLDLGHIIIELQNELSSRQLSVAVEYMFDRSYFRKNLKLDDDIFSGCLLHIEDQGIETACLSLELEEKDVCLSHKCVNHSKSLGLLGITEWAATLEKMDSFYVQSIRKCKIQAKNQSYKRSSDNTSVGLLDRGFQLSVEEWHDIFTLSHNVLRNYQGMGEFTLHLFIKNQEVGRNGYYRIGHNDTTYTVSTVEIEALLYDSQEFFNLEDSSFAAFVTYGVTKESMAEQIYYSHVCSAEIIHQLSAYFFGKNYFTRPMKNFDDAYIKEVCCLPQEEKVMYLLLVGAASLKEINSEDDFSSKETRPTQTNQ